jgi:hypothetical protein
MTLFGLDRVDNLDRVSLPAPYIGNVVGNGWKPCLGCLVNNQKLKGGLTK